ncbi:NADPH-dependent FMN reductase [Roseibium aestuarii]|uniref:NADPH-dependent FMN reductase n=1 Tax=Roseibium aestuarii TaxID=2600299 RepID=A0ABW4K0R1_9HYPH|nr:NAD(P)H-dependent oxidoreductase [Roseibium aestuarii]
MRQTRILSFSGSIRAGSYNTRLAGLVTKKLALADAEATWISLKDYPLPLYDADLEQDKGVPENAFRLKRLFQAQDGIFIACPEYNAAMTPILKNTLDWISRANGPGEPATAAFRRPVFALGSASPGGFGGMRGLIGTRTVLEVGLGALVLPRMVSIARADKAFDTAGELTDEGLSAQLDGLVETLLDHARRLNAAR